MDVSRHTEVGWIDDLVGARVIEDGLGMDTGLVGEGAKAGDVVVERDINLDSLGDEVFNVLDHLQLVLALDVVPVCGNHASHEATERSDSVTFADPENRRVNVGSSGFEGTIGICDRTPSVIVQVDLDIALDHSPENPDQLVNLSWRCATNGIGNTNTIDTHLVHGRVDGKE